MMKLMLWLDSHAWSTALHESLWAYPLIESTHVWALAFFVGFAALLDIRLLGVSFGKIAVSEFYRRLMPWTIVSFVVMVATGVLLFYAIPVRSYQNIFFRIKILLLIVAGLNVWVFHRGIWKRVAEWDEVPRPPRRARQAAAASLALWAGIIICGRMIAYNWFDCDRQPQPAIVNWLTSCDPTVELP